MAHSMTGYGRAREGTVTVELRAVNHRYLDISVRIPRMCAFLEEPLKALVGRTVSRGKLDMGVTIESLYADSTRMLLNRRALEEYLAAAQAVCAEYGLENDLTVARALALPEVMAPVREEMETQALTELVLSVAGRAMADFGEMRAREGDRLAADILAKADEIERLVALVEENMPASVEAYRRRLEAKITEILAGKLLDESRILTEVALFAERVTVDEETVRLRSHVGALRSMLGGKTPVGRKLDFLVQEMGREINTIGSKCSDLRTSRLVIDVKAEIEKIREQVQNIE